MGFVRQVLTSPSLPKPPTMFAPRRREAVGDVEGIILEKFQRELLREHHVSGEYDAEGGKVTSGASCPKVTWQPMFSEVPGRMR